MKVAAIMSSHRENYSKKNLSYLCGHIITMSKSLWIFHETEGHMGSEFPNLFSSKNA